MQTLFKCVLSEADCIIICGHRGEKEQNEAFDKGFSRRRWPDGEHNSFPSRAVDVMPWPLDWKDAERAKAFAKIVKHQAECLGIRVVWGGDWPDFVDLPHWELADDEA